MFKASKALVTDNSFIVFVPRQGGGNPIAYVKIKAVLRALNAVGMDNGTGALSTVYNEALVELARYAKENDL